MVAANVILAFVLFLFLPGDVRALTIDPDGFASGTDISSAFPGISLSATGGGFGASGAVFSVDPQDPSFTGDAHFLASTGTRVFGHDGNWDGSSPNGHVWKETAPLWLTVVFASGATSVSLDFIGNDSSDSGVLEAFDASSTLLDTHVTSPLGVNQIETMTVSAGSSAIAYVRASGLDGDTGGLDNLQYEPTPEPSTALLVATGLAALAAAKRRRRSYCRRAGTGSVLALLPEAGDRSLYFDDGDRLA